MVDIRPTPEMGFLMRFMGRWCRDLHGSMGGLVDSYTALVTRNHGIFG